MAVIERGGFGFNPVEMMKGHLHELARMERATQEEQRHRRETLERFRQMLMMFGPEAVQVEYILSDHTTAPGWLKEYVRELMNTGGTKVAKVIGPFTGEHRWLSNFWPVQVEYEGMVFPSVEHAYQAAKCARLEDREIIRRALSPAEAKRYGRKVQIRPGWDEMKLKVMEQLLRQKFAPGTELARKLLATGDAQLVEYNTWGDTFWGVCDGRGQNMLGRLLMKIREELRDTGEGSDVKTQKVDKRPRIYTVNINLANQLGLLYADVTVKSGDPVFAPTWDMVMGHKEGRVSDDEYIRRYVEMMRRSYRNHRPSWDALLGQREVYLACYCRPGTRFCHRYILAEILERLGAELAGEIVGAGEDVPIPRLASGYLKPQKEVVAHS